MQDLVLRNLTFRWKSIYEITQLSGTIRPVTATILMTLESQGLVEKKTEHKVTYWRRIPRGTPVNEIKLNQSNLEAV